MKKNSKPRTEKTKRDDPELQTLNSSLGSFGLEPPKIYRRETDSQPSKREVREPRRNRSSEPKNINERRAGENRNRKKAQQRRKILLSIGLALTAAVLLIILCLTVFFKISTITVKGNKIYSTQDITAVLPISEGQNLFVCDTKKAKSKLEENLPYIYNAEIKRKIPSGITVSITETPVIYSIQNTDKSYTHLDGHFKVLEINAKKKKKAVLIKNAVLKGAVVGLPAEFKDDTVKNNLKEIINKLSEMKINNVTAIYSNDINNNFVVFESRITVKLGTIDNLEHKLDMALSAMSKLSKSNPQAEGTLTITNNKRVYFSEN
ncbi:MAG: FtsQ-type POTRA domain-containing protein [Eubacterium sp.]|nr:FtsQ-type POTRA domain-containing protein [Eubacterium sp.]